MSLRKQIQAPPMFPCEALIAKVLAAMRDRDLRDIEGESYTFQSVAAYLEQHALGYSRQWLDMVALVKRDEAKGIQYRPVGQDNEGYAIFMPFNPKDEPRTPQRPTGMDFLGKMFKGKKPFASASKQVSQVSAGAPSDHAKEVALCTAIVLAVVVAVLRIHGVADALVDALRGY